MSVVRVWNVAIVAVVFAIFGTAQAAPTPSPRGMGPFGKNPVDVVKEEVEKEMTEAQKATEARLKALEEAQSKVGARVVVLQWQGSDTNYRNELVQRNVKARIARPSAKFYPDVDLYQFGRKEKDRTLRPLDQRARVPSEVIPRIDAVVREIEAMPWDGISETEWGIRAQQLIEMTDEVWFIDRPELRVPMFKLYVQIGRAAENSNQQTPPFFEQVAGVSVNYYYYLAAAMASQTPDLMQNLSDPEMYGNINNIKRQLEDGAFDPMRLNFELGGIFDVRKFTEEYVVYFNGMPHQITNEEALYEVPPGIMDIYLERPGDGYGMSVRVEAVRLDEEEVYSVRDQARKQMGLDFIKQLMKNEEQCIPDVQGDILNYLAIYQKLHPGSEIYVAVPKGGSVNKVLLWKWIEKQGRLIRINDNTGGFPVRFAGLVGTGLNFGSATLKAPSSVIEKTPPTNLDDPLADLSPGDFLDLNAQGLPFSYELRGHWDRLYVAFGMDLTLNLQGGWQEIAHTQTSEQIIDQDGTVFTYRNDANSGNTQRLTLTQSTVNNGGTDYTVSEPVMMKNDFSRGLYFSVGGVFGREAAYGYGPRIALRTGLVNMPHAVDLTLHGGMSIPLKPKSKQKANTRVHPIVDTDLYGGMMLPYGDTFHLLTTQAQGETETVTMRGAADDNGDPAPEIWGRQAAGPNGVDGAGNRLAAIGDEARRPIGDPIPTFGFVLRAGLTF